MVRLDDCLDRYARGPAETGNTAIPSVSSTTRHLTARIALLDQPAQPVARANMGRGRYRRKPPMVAPRAHVSGTPPREG